MTTVFELSSPKTMSPAIPQWRLGAHDRVTLDDELDFVPSSQDMFGHVLRRVDNPDLCESFTHEQFEALRVEGRLIISRGFYLATKAKLRSASSAARLTDLSSEKQIKVLWRQSICDRFLRMEASGAATRSDVSMKAAIQRIVADLLAVEFANGRCGSADISVKRPPSPRTLRRWLQMYEAAAFNPMALLDSYHRCGDRQTVRFETEERALMRTFAELYASSRKPTKIGLLQDLHAEIEEQNAQRRQSGERLLKRPRRRAFERVINSLDPFMVYAGRHSPEAARKKFYIVNQGLDVTRPFERIEVDENKIPVQTLLMDAGIWARLTPQERAKIKPARYWLSVAIDTATRCCVAALVVENPSANTAVATLEMAVSDKSAYAEAAGCQTPWDMFGTPESVAQDSGSQFISHEYCAAITDLESEALFPPAGLPQMRARIERFFRGMNKGLFSRVDGQTFENIVVKGDYDAEGRAVLDVAALQRIITRWIVDVYHNTQHGGLRGETPRNAWLRLTKLYPPIAPPDDALRRHIFGATFERRITNEGIRLLGLTYQNPQLQRLRARVGLKSVLVRTNPADLGTISVREEEGWLPVPCLQTGFQGVPVTRWLAAEQLLRRTNAEMANLAEPVVYQALREIQAASDAATMQAGIASPVLLPIDYPTLERDRFRSVSFARGEEGGPAIPIGDLPAGETAQGGESDDAKVTQQANKTVMEPPAAKPQGDDFFVED